MEIYIYFQNIQLSVKMTQIQSPSACNNSAFFVYVVWNLNIKQSWQFGREAKLHSASGFSEQKYVKEKECDFFFFAPLFLER